MAVGPASDARRRAGPAVEFGAGGADTLAGRPGSGVGALSPRPPLPQSHPRQLARRALVAFALLASLRRPRRGAVARATRVAAHDPAAAAQLRAIGMGCSPSRRRAALGLWLEAVRRTSSRGRRLPPVPRRHARVAAQAEA
jgi:hypothetical protein